MEARKNKGWSSRIRGEEQNNSTFDPCSPYVTGTVCASTRNGCEGGWEGEGASRGRRRRRKCSGAQKEEETHVQKKTKKKRAKREGTYCPLCWEGQRAGRDFPRVTGRSARGDSGLICEARCVVPLSRVCTLSRMGYRETGRRRERERGRERAGGEGREREGAR